MPSRSSAHYNATLLLWLRTAALLDAYATARGIPTTPERDEMLMTEPRSPSSPRGVFARIARIACLQPRNTPSRFVAWTARQVSSVGC